MRQTLLTYSHCPAEVPPGHIPKNLANLLHGAAGLTATVFAVLARLLAVVKLLVCTPSLLIADDFLLSVLSGLPWQTSGKHHLQQEPNVFVSECVNINSRCPSLTYSEVAY